MSHSFERAGRVPCSRCIGTLRVATELRSAADGAWTRSLQADVRAARPMPGWLSLTRSTPPPNNDRVVCLLIDVCAKPSPVADAFCTRQTLACKP
jgi:hypothetical protein